MRTNRNHKSIRVLLLAALALFTTNVMAQETSVSGQALKKPTLNDLIPGGETFRRVENLYGVQWWGDVCIKPDIDSLFSIDPKTGKETLLLTRTQVNETVEVSLQHFYNVEFPWADKPYMLIKAAKSYVVYDFRAHKAVVSLPRAGRSGNEANTDFNYNYEQAHLAYTVGNDLFVDGKAVTDEPRGIVCGQSVHRNEFGISKGTFWSPKGTLLAFYRMDESMVTEYPLVDITARVGEVNPVRYPMAGMTSHKVQVGIYNPSTGQTVYLNTGDPTDRYFTNITWSPDEQSLYLIELNRDQNHAKLCRYNATTGEPDGILLEETHPKYVEPQTPITFLPWDDTKFIYQSQRDGYNHLYLYDLKKLSSTDDAGTQLTSGPWLVKELLGFNAKKKEIYFSATKESPLQTNIYKVGLNNKKITRLDNGEGVHNATLSASGTYLIDRYSTPTVPRVINLLATQNGKSTATLFTARNPYEGFEMPSIETGTIKAADGTTDLYYRLVKPADFDPNKKYPTIVYVYGGPHAQMITNGWQNDARGWDLYMAGKGYIMFSLDNRGSSNRGLEFENVTFRHLGIEEGKDQVKGVEFLKSLPYVDANRIGVHGWSFGGHMTTALMLRYPETFKVGVAGGPVIDWAYYEVMYGERYMDTPQTNPDGYKACNLKELAGNLKGHLLIIHDDHDDTCVPQHTLSFMKACVDARTYPDLFIYPGHQHNVRGIDRVHLHEKITRYFEDYL
ncbi:MAG: S9 family peptidase [Bacteroides sp.]|nr:S9 family peptidase [Bacteroides sp.]